MLEALWENKWSAILFVSAIVVLATSPIPGIIIQSAFGSTGPGLPVDSPSAGPTLFSHDTSTGPGLHASNTSTGRGFYAYNTSTGQGFYATNTSTHRTQTQASSDPESIRKSAALSNQLLNDATARTIQTMTNIAIFHHP